MQMLQSFQNLCNTENNSAQLFFAHRKRDTKLPLQVLHTTGSKWRTICICVHIMDRYLVLAKIHHLNWELLNNVPGTCKCFEVFLWPTVKGVGVLHGYVYKFHAKQLTHHAVLGQLVTDCHSTHQTLQSYCYIYTNKRQCYCVKDLCVDVTVIHKDCSDHNLARVVRIQHTCRYIQGSDQSTLTACSMIAKINKYIACYLIISYSMKKYCDKLCK